MTDIFDKLDKLEDLPSLRSDYVRLVHRLVYGNGANFDSIKQNGLIFNRQAAGCLPSQRGGSYTQIESMATLYDEDLFWNSLKHDDFACYNDAAFADVKMVFDIPKEEFAFLNGFRSYGKIDAKYLVGCIPNYNSANKNLRLPLAEVEKAHLISKSNPPHDVSPNNLGAMVTSFLDAHKGCTKGMVKARMLQILDKLDSDFTEQKMKNTKSSNMVLTSTRFLQR
jgi:hypothetical protein